MKYVKQRGLPLNTQYVVTDKKYIPLENGIGLCCDNCGKLIANIATVKNPDGKSFNIGFDCLETILINNHLLSATDVEEYEKVKKMIPKVLRFAKSIKETIKNNPNINITGMLFSKRPTYKTDYYPFHWLKNNELKGRDNDVVKLKEVDMDFLITTLKNIFPKLNIFIEE